LNLSLKIRINFKTGKPALLTLQVVSAEGHSSPLVTIDEFHEGHEKAVCGAPCHTGSEPAMTLARDWIMICKDHGLCQNDWALKHHPIGFRPTRLLKVTSDPRPRVRLVLPAEEMAREPDQIVKYVALSYCWGQGEVPKLNMDLLDAFRDSIDYSTLPKTFQDALSTTSALGYEYLFIDSLCILQDSLDDWNTEAARMGDVYASAVLTISAAHGNDPHTGLFTTTPPFMRDCVLRKDGQICLQARSSSTNVETINPMFDVSIELAPLSKRAWVFQERILPKRILHFADGYVLFECNDMRASECHRAGVPYTRKPNIRADGHLHSSAMLSRLAREDDHHTVRMTHHVTQ
jgi:hypothetical protein